MHGRTRPGAWALTVVVVLMCCGGAYPAAAQQQTGTLTGTVVDDSGGVVPGATAIATETATGVKRTAFANEQGVFRMAALPPGQYSLRVELSGFRPVDMKEITLLSSEVRDLGKLVVAVGTQTEAVTVTAEVTQVQFTNLNASYTFTGPNNSVINSTTTGRYIAPQGSLGVTPPRQLGLTVRLDF